VPLSVSVIIPTYNRKFILEKCLMCLGHQSFPAPDYEIIVVDDGSTDDTETMVKSLKLFPVLKYLPLNHSGRAAARNAGINQAEGEIIIFIDSDILVGEQFVQTHAESHYQKDGIIVQGPIIPVKEPIVPVKSSKLQGYHTAYFTTSNVSIRKKYLLEAGLFDTQFQEYGWEDLELGIRLRKLGLKSRFNFGAKTYHYQPLPDYRDVKDILQKEIERGKTAFLFYRKHPTLEVKLMTQMWAPFLWLDRLLNINRWMDRKDPTILLPDIKRKWGKTIARVILKILSYHYNQLGIRKANKDNSLKI